jgi:hypothetical protein
VNILSNRFSPLRQQLTRNMTHVIFCSALFCFATAAFAAPTVAILSPKASAGSGSPVFYEAYATSPSCASGINAMRIYPAPGVNAFTTYGAHIETFIPLSPGNYSTVVQAWDNCGGVGKATVDIAVNSDAGISVFLPSNTSAGTPVHIAASAQNPDCSAGINAIRIYSANGIAPYTVESDQVNAFVNLLAAADYNLTLIAWDNCGHTYKYDFVETAVATPDSYLYAVNESSNANTVAKLNISNGVLANPNGSGNPPLFAAAKVPLSIAIDPGGWFAWVFTTTAIYGYQIDQSSGNLWAMPGSPFPLSGTPISEPSGFLYPEPNALAVDPNGNFVFATYDGSNTLVAYQVNRSTGALTKAGSATGSGGMMSVTADFTGQYVYAINNNSDNAKIFGYAINQNNGALTAVPGSPYTLPNSNFGGTVSSTMLPGSPGSPLLYAGTGGSSSYSWGYHVNYDTGALTAVPGSPFYEDGAGLAMADNQGKWVGGFGAFPSSPPQDFYAYASINSAGTLSTTQMENLNIEYNIDSEAEDGSGKFLYTGGFDCPNNVCTSGSYSNVNSWTVGANGVTVLSGPLFTGGATVMSVGAAPKHGD